MSRHEVLTEATHCVLLCPTGEVPSVLPVACWFDGAHVWASVAVDGPEVAALRAGRSCAALFDRDPGWVVAYGPSRTYGLDEPFRLVLHGAAVSAAMAALALHHPRAVVGSAITAARAGRLPAGQLAVRLQAKRLRSMTASPPAPGIAPGLPLVVPADVRRAVAGRRDIAVGVTRGDELVVEAGGWDGDYRLHAAGIDPGTVEAATVVVVARSEEVGEAVGVALHGPVDAGGRLQPSHATWWSGVTRGSASLPPPGPAITLPD